jgi:hypothetical protein
MRECQIDRNKLILEKVVSERKYKTTVYWQIYILIIMDKAEADRLSKELWELSEHEKQNKERMLEIAKVLVAYYMWWKKK